MIGRRFLTLGVGVAVLLSTGTAVPQEAKKGSYVTVELSGEAAWVEMKGTLRADKDLKQPYVRIGTVALFRLEIGNEQLRKLATQLNEKIVVVTGTLDLHPTQNRNYVVGQLLGQQPIVRVDTLKAAGGK